MTGSERGLAAAARWRPDPEREGAKRARTGAAGALPPCRPGAGERESHGLSQSGPTGSRGLEACPGMRSMG